MSRLLLAAAVALAVAAGFLGAFFHHEEAQAAENNKLLWLGSAHAPADNWWYFCVGVRGYHTS